jgi:hypothetical protein
MLGMSAPLEKADSGQLFVYERTDLVSRTPMMLQPQAVASSGPGTHHLVVKGA